MSNYSEMSLKAALEAAYFYLKNIYDTNEIILALRVYSWTKWGIAAGLVLYALM